MFDESKISIERLGGNIVVLNMQHADLNRLRCKKGESGNREGTSEALSVECGVDGNDKDFAESRIGRSFRVDSGPAEPGKGSVDLVKQKPFGVEPWLLGKLVEVIVCPVRLVGMPCEGQVVHTQERVVIHTQSECPGGKRRGRIGKWKADSELLIATNEAEAGGGCFGRVSISGWF